MFCAFCVLFNLYCIDLHTYCIFCIQSAAFLASANEAKPAMTKRLPLLEKTELCAFSYGQRAASCKFGANCSFAHRLGELNPGPSGHKVMIHRCMLHVFALHVM